MRQASTTALESLRWSKVSESLDRISFPASTARPAMVAKKRSEFGVHVSLATLAVLGCMVQGIVSRFSERSTTLEEDPLGLQGHEVRFGDPDLVSSLQGVRGDRAASGAG